MEALFEFETDSDPSESSNFNASSDSPDPAKKEPLQPEDQSKTEI
ncbi:15807_t:CDS:2 [Entrophospora sp. SA101]|nr:15807_t:CDS:2 [Entrophospora sp. SA101]